MEQEKQDKNAEIPVISPLAHERTYGEVWYNRVFNWGANYWANLLVSAGFSQWAEHGTRPFKLPFLMNEAATPRDMQQKLAEGVRKYDPVFKRFEQNKLKEMAGQAAEVIEKTIADRSMSRARSLTLLLPGFAIMIPSVWLGAKIKPWFVETLNRKHYGDEAMDDPSLKARHQAIEAEERPTLLGTITARFGTVFVAQAAAQLAGSENNLINKMGAKNFKGIDPVADGIGTALGGSMPAKLQTRVNNFAQRRGLNWSEAQRVDHKMRAKTAGAYTNATQDFGSFVARDTIYTLTTALTVHPLLRLLQHVPGMTYKPKVAADSARFDGDRIKIASRPLRDDAEDVPAREEAANDPHIDSDKPAAKVSNVSAHERFAAPQHHKLA